MHAYHHAHRFAARFALAVALLAVPLAPALPAFSAEDGGDEGGEPGRAPIEHTIGALFIDYMPDTITINAGDSLRFVNTDPVAGEGHTVTQATTPDFTPMFDSPVTPFGADTGVTGVSDLKAGEYLITCRVHPIMKALLFVGTAPRQATDRVPDLSPVD